MKISSLILAAASMVFLTGITTASAQTNKMRTNRSTADTSFVTKAAEGGLAEVELGNLAVQKASNPDVKQFGQRMVDDHSKANDQLRQVATNNNIPMPTTISSQDQALKDRLSKLSGPAFDKAYMQAMVKDHQTDVAEFQREASHAVKQDIKSFASTTLPTLQEHLTLARSTYSKVETGATPKQ